MWPPSCCTFANVLSQILQWKGYLLKRAEERRRLGKIRSVVPFTDNVDSLFVGCSSNFSARSPLEMDFRGKVQAVTGSASRILEFSVEKALGV